MYQRRTGYRKVYIFKKIGEKLADRGENIDFLHCSADENSLDGIICTDKKTAIIDGTGPHIIDPITPGAVDFIINFGEFWNEKKIADCREELINYNEECSKWYKNAYNYLTAAKSVYNNLSAINDEGVEISEIYKLSSEIIEREYRKYDISIKAGSVKRFFATAITPGGMVSFVKTLLYPLKKIYLINVPEGYGNSSFMNILMEGAIYRGFNVECYYCPMEPGRKIEHLLIPELELGFTTVNRWHDLEPWEIITEEENQKEIVMIDINDYRSTYFQDKNSALIHKSSEIYANMLDEAVSALSKAKEYHDMAEKMYARNMNFEKIDTLIEKTVEDIV